jgi:hypothetical protein
MKATIVVTQEDIDYASSHSDCPIQRAAKRQFKGVVVGRDIIWFTRRWLLWDREESADLPREAQSFIHQFDSGALDAVLLPFNFQINTET